jgi:hypothetical protein
MERVLVQYLSRALGPAFRVLRGGHVPTGTPSLNSTIIDHFVTGVHRSA